jgi:N-acetylglutamate synthase-like GNAT family acetyltransferase
MFSIQPRRPAHDAQVELIRTFATSKLRAIYTPIPSENNSAAPSEFPFTSIVALNDANVVVGTADYMINTPSVFIQGIAVATTYRCRGVARTMLNHIEMLAAKSRLSSLQIKTIQETGNVGIFQRMGFHVIGAQKSERFIGTNGQVVNEITLQCDVARL